MLCRLRRVDVADWSKKICREPIKICQDKLGEISNALEVNKQKFAICRMQTKVPLYQDWRALIGRDFSVVPDSIFQFF